MSALRLKRAVLIAFLILASFIAAIAYARWDQVSYARAVSDLDYKLCQSNRPPEFINCEIEAKRTSILMDAGRDSLPVSAAVPVALLWVFFAAITVISSLARRWARKLFIHGQENHGHAPVSGL